MKISRILSCALLFTSAGAVTSCADKASCDKGETLCSGLCLPLSVCPGAPSAGPAGEGGTNAGNGGASTDTDPDDSSGFECDSAEPTEVEFGDVCSDDKDHSDCGCPAPVCAIAPGSEEGFCTQINCDLADSSSCPAGYTCSDFSAFQPGAPPICWK